MASTAIRNSAGRTPKIYGRAKVTRYALTKTAPTKREQESFERTHAIYRSSVIAIRESKKNTCSLRGLQHLLIA